MIVQSYNTSYFICVTTEIALELKLSQTQKTFLGTWTCEPTHEIPKKRKTNKLQLKNAFTQKNPLNS